MCGRASQYGEFSIIEKRFGPLVTASIPNAQPRYNAAPRNPLLIVRQDNQAGGRVVELARWGLIPAWAKDSKIGDRAINARDVGDDGRGLDEKPMFREAWRSGRRCLVPLNSFFEWRKVGKAKQPYAIGLADGEMIGVAGLWETWRDRASGEMVRSFTIITTATNEALASLHDRMPVIIAPEHFEAWLTGGPAAARELLRPYPADQMRLWRVTPRVNRVGDLDAAECVAPLVG